MNCIRRLHEQYRNEERGARGRGYFGFGPPRGGARGGGGGGMGGGGRGAGLPPWLLFGGAHGFLGLPPGLLPLGGGPGGPHGGAGRGTGPLPARLAYSERDFDESDYEALLALDDAVKPPSHRRATKKDIKRCSKTVTVGGTGKNSKPPEKLETCAICLEDPQQGDTVRVLQCGHSFHRECIDRWLNKENKACPVCKADAC